MARWKNGGVHGSKSWGKEGDQTKRMLLAEEQDSAEDDQYIRPSLRYAIAAEKREYRCMTIMTLTSFIFLFTLGTCLLLHFSREYTEACPVCRSVANSMDRSVDPCEDFYQFSCGNWEKNVRIPAGHSKWGSFGEVYSQIKRRLKKVLVEEGCEYQGRTSTALQKAKAYYRACMDEAGIEQAGSQPLKRLLSGLGGWSMVPADTPGLGNWDEREFNLTMAVIAAHENGAAALFDMVLSPDERNSSNSIIQFYQSGVGFAATELYNDNDTTHEEAYAALGAKVVVLLSLADGESVNANNFTKHPSYEPALQRMREIVEFEANISRIYVPKEDLLDPVKTYNKMTLRELADIIPQVNISLYLNEIFKADISLDEVVLVPVQAYLERLNNLLVQTPNRLLADYVTWYVIKTVLKYMPKIYEDIIVEYNSIFSGSNTTELLWEKCVKRTDGHFGFVTGALFAREIVTPLFRNETRDLIQYIRDSFIDNLPDVEWMEDETKLAAKEKALAIRPKIGFPLWIEDPDKLDEHYEMLNITSSSYFENAMNFKTYYLARMRDELGQPVDREEWHMSPAEVNAYYSSSFNEIVFPLGILQSPYYDIRYPMSMNFGAIGMVMGHELTHGFDDHGRKFDKDGNLRDWWGNSSAAAYVNKTDCMVKQYSRYKIGNSFLDGRYTLSENIADNGGLKIAYRAWQTWLGSRNETRELRRLGMSQDQLFFVGFSQVWCTYVTPQYAEMSLYTDSHAAENYRVNGAVSNMPEFAAAYDCPAGSPMNPTKKCEVW